MSETLTTIDSKITPVPFDERTAKEWAELSGHIDPITHRELTVLAVMTKKAQEQGAQGAFLSDSPNYLSPEALTYNDRIRRTRPRNVFGHAQHAEKRKLALVAQHSSDNYTYWRAR